MRRILGLLLASTVVGACYHATIETGLPASPEVLEKSFAAGWIYGLVPPSTVSTAAKCPNGAAKIETQLVNFLTLGIYTPMSIKVTCAARPGTSLVPSKPDVRVAPGADDLEVQAAIQAAADLAVALRRPVLVQF